MAEDHGVLEAEQLPRALTKGRTETESRQERAARKVRSSAVQNEMRSILGRITEGAG